MRHNNLCVGTFAGAERSGDWVILFHPLEGGGSYPSFGHNIIVIPEEFIVLRGRHQIEVFVTLRGTGEEGRFE